MSYPPNQEPPRYEGGDTSGAPQDQPPAYGPPPAYSPPPAYGPPPAYPAGDGSGQPPVYNAPQMPAGGVPGPGEPFDGAEDPDDMSRPLYGASFGQAIKRFFRGYVKFNGRASRSEYWWVALFSFLATLIPIVLVIVGVFMLVPAIAMADENIESTDFGMTSAGGSVGPVLIVIGSILLVLITLGFILPTYAIGWRRMHDGGFAGPLYLINLAGVIPYVGWLAQVVVLIFTILPSKPEGRRYDVPQ